MKWLFLLHFITKHYSLSAADTVKRWLPEMYKYWRERPFFFGTTDQISTFLYQLWVICSVLPCSCAAKLTANEKWVKIPLISLMANTKTQRIQWNLILDCATPASLHLPHFKPFGVIFTVSQRVIQTDCIYFWVMDWYAGSEWRIHWSERYGRRQTANSNPQRLPTAISHYYRSLHWDTARHWSSHTKESRETPQYHMGPTRLHEHRLPSRSCTSYMHARTQNEERRTVDVRDKCRRRQRSGWKDTLIHWLTNCPPVYLSVPLSDYRYPCQVPRGITVTPVMTWENAVHEAINVPKHYTFCP